ncbi:MAG TPA: glycoside hydrolase family 5 protein [Clostridia bacterium]|nr:glycoside hydrolase family 5 protein [Clostridia bacterium]
MTLTDSAGRNAVKTFVGLWLIALGCAAPFSSVADSIRYAGVNLASAEFGDKTLPGTYGSTYIYPNQTEVEYFKSKGMNIVRLPFLWERLQPTANAAFNSAEFNRLHSFVSATTAKGVYVLIDLHNYARYYGNAIGSAAAPISVFSNFWSRLATVYRTNDHVILGLMNEPHDMTTEAWRDAANAAILAIRATGATNLVLVPGNSWTGAHSWTDSWYGTPNAVAMLSITDPANNFAFEVHQYLDSDSSGTSSQCVNTTIGADRLKKFTQWCRTNDRRGFLGEFGCSTNAPCLQSLENMLAYIDANLDVWEGWTYWAAGPWWGEYMYTVEPKSGSIDRAQMSVLENHVPLPAPTLTLSNATQFQFTALPGLVYQPTATSDITNGPWTNFGSAIIGTGQTARVDTSSSSGTRCFYRVRVSRAP